MNKLFVIAGVLALGALGLAFVLQNQPEKNAKTVMLEPTKVLKTAKSSAKNANIKSAGSLEDLTKGAPEPRAVTTDAIVVPPKPVSSATSTSKPASSEPASSEPTSASSSVVSPTPVAANQTSDQATKTVPELSSTIEKPTSTNQTSNLKETTPTVTDPSNQTNVQAATDIKPSSTSETPPTLPLRRSEGSVSIQAGAFKSAENAEGLRAQLEDKGFKASVEVGSDGISRVIVGPYPNEQTARAAANRISSR